MFAKHLRGWLFLALITLLLGLSLIAGCGGGAATPTPAMPSVTLNLSSNSPQVPEGREVSIVIKVEPYELLDWTWEVSGSSGGQLNTVTGENVVYKAGKEGIDTVVAKAKTASGAILRQFVSLNVVSSSAITVPAQSSAPAQLAAPTPLLPTETLPPTATPSSTAVTLASLQNDQSVPCDNVAEGRYPLELTDHIWPVVFISGRFHPQDEGGQAAQMVDGKWYQTVRFGNCDQPQRDVGKRFQLIIVTADEQANKAFEDYMTVGQSTHNWPGMTNLPAGIKEQVRIIVTRQ